MTRQQTHHDTTARVPHTPKATSSVVAHDTLTGTAWRAQTKAIARVGPFATGRATALESVSLERQASRGTLRQRLSLASTTRRATIAC
jgi:hypothetical protein